MMRLMILKRFVCTEQELCKLPIKHKSTLFLYRLPVFMFFECAEKLAEMSNKLLLTSHGIILNYSVRQSRTNFSRTFAGTASSTDASYPAPVRAVLKLLLARN